MRTDLVFGQKLGVQEQKKRSQTRVTLEEIADKRKSGGISIIKSQLDDDTGKFESRKYHDVVL